jgi:hypothetical protein
MNWNWRSGTASAGSVLANSVASDAPPAIGPDLVKSQSAISFADFQRLMSTRLRLSATFSCKTGRRSGDPGGSCRPRAGDARRRSKAPTIRGPARPRRRQQRRLIGGSARKHDLLAGSDPQRLALGNRLYPDRAPALEEDLADHRSFELLEVWPVEILPEIRRRGRMTPSALHVDRNEADAIDPTAVEVGIQGILQVLATRDECPSPYLTDACSW